MNKRKVDRWLPVALRVLKDPEHSLCWDKEKTKIDPGFRAQISAFGAAITMGSFKAAIAFFSDKKNADVDRTKLIEAMYAIIHDGEKSENAKTIMDMVFQINKPEELAGVKEDFINASIALKLAMNAFVLEKEEKKGKGGVKQREEPESVVQ